MQTLNRAIECAGAWVWENSVAATVLIFLVWAVQGTFGKRIPPRWKHGLWLLVALRLVLPAAPTAAFSIFNLGQLWPKQGPTAKQTVQGELGAVVVSAGGSGLQMLEHRGISADPHLLNWDVRPGRDTNLEILLAWLWALGALLYLGFVLEQHRRLATWARRQEPCRDPQLRRLLDECKQRLGLRRKLEVITTERFRVPTLFGFWRPRLLLPAGILGKPELLRMVLLHELVHLKRHHVLQNWGLVLLQALHWFNPAVWLAFRRLRAERELACDAGVLSVLDPIEHHGYGTALLKVLEMSTQSLRMPAVVPIVGNHKQIHRRITMIVEFKSTPPLIGVASALVLAGLAALTFTGASAQEKTARAENPRESRGAQTGERSNVQTERAEPDRLRILERELDAMKRQVRETQARADELKVKLGIPDVTTEANGLGRLESVRIEAEAAYQEVSSLHRNLAKMSPTELRRALPTASPDPILIELLQRLTTAEQNLAEASETYGQDHLEVRKKKRILESLNNHVAERISGILAGLETKAQTYKARMDSLRDGINAAKRAEIETAVKKRPYEEALRELETLRAAQEQLLFRVLQEKVDRELPRSPKR